MPDRGRCQVPGALGNPPCPPREEGSKVRFVEPVKRKLAQGQEEEGGEDISVDCYVAFVEKPGLLRVLTSVFVLLGAFLTVSTYFGDYLGGGAAGVGLAVVIALGVTAFYSFFYGWLVKRPAIRQLLKAQTAELAIAKAPKQEAYTHEPGRSSDAPPLDEAASSPLGPLSVCSPGPHEVVPGRFTRITLNVAMGKNVIGRLEEQDRYDFDWMILDEDNFVKLQQGRRCVAALKGHGEPAYKLEWQVPREGPWFLILEAYGKQYTREVWVDLRLT